MDEQERQEINIEALQRELLELQHEALTDNLIDLTEKYQQAKAMYEVAITRQKLRKSRISAIQSVLKSATRF